ncbi:unnamed protein product [Discula destructiva]
MLRSTRSILIASARQATGASSPLAPLATSHTQRFASSATWRAQAPSTVYSRQLVPYAQRARYASKVGRDVAFEKEVAKQKLEADPEHVDSESSVRHLEGPGSRPVEGSTTDSLKGDLGRMQEALALSSVPPLSYQLGLSGTIPYLATSLATVYLSWDSNAEWPSQSQFLNHIMISHEQAIHYLHLLEPIQVGYGAIIISFLGAIHWGLEYAEKHPNAARTRFRYGMGLLAPVIAWPTLLLPVQFALTAQFLAFTFMYFADARATTRGWAPQWYGTYRFVLTFIVGSAILISLIGREKVGADRPHLDGLREKFHKEPKDTLAQHEWEAMEEKEREKNHRIQAAEEKKKQAEEEIKKAEESKKAAEGDKKTAEKGGSKKGKEDGAKKESKASDKKDSEGHDESKDEETDGSESEKKDEGDGDKKEESGDDKKDEKSE